MWTVGDITYHWDADWFQGWAAMLQAVLTAAAVYAAAALQDRGFEKRERAIRDRRLENVASMARYIWDTYSEIVDPLPDGSTRPAVAERWEMTANYRWRKALEATEAPNLGDAILSKAVFDLEAKLMRCEVELNRVANWVPELMNEPPATLALSARTIEAFDAAVSVDRRVAELVGRQAKL